jgi:signal transduction histidine kinase
VRAMARGASRLLAPFVDPETYRALIFYIATLALGVAGFAVVVAGWCVTAFFAITPLVVPLLIGLRVGVGALAAAEASVARDLLGPAGRPPMDTPAQGFWNRGFAILKDRHFWRQQAYLLASWPVALVALVPFSFGFQTLAIPFYYRAPEGADLFGAHVDTFREALLAVPVGLGLLTLGVHLLRPLSALSRLLATRLLRDAELVDRRTPAERRATRLRALTIDALVSTSLVVLLVVIWLLTTPDGYFWPIWPLLSLALVVAIPGWVLLVLEHPGPRRLANGSTALAIQVGVSAVLAAFLVAVWAVTTPGGYFWPVWPALGLALAAVVHAAVVHARRVHRIEVLEESRAGAIDVQDAELRRIERDLHDGAQARLVGLGMSLGMAEQKLGSDPEAVRELLAEARRGAGEALVELRHLARGIHPPILTDRGLEAAVAALIVHSPLPVALSVDVPKRPPGSVESAAYFVVSEALANVIKHAGASRVGIRIEQVNGMLVAEVADDGCGGADPAGRGLTGLGQRVRALDGTLRVTSPEGGPTTLRAELPCG